MQESNTNKDGQISKACALVTPLPGEQEGADYYLNENGLITFTAKYHLDRGYCCGNGCRHCPFDFESVPEPKRSWLLENRHNPKDHFTE
jgi:hypothetical protein